MIALVSELFPPAIGGSAVLFENVYSRIFGHDVTVLTDVPNAVGTPRGDRLRVVGAPIATRRWGIADPRALLHHLHVARAIRRVAARANAVVHCGRALPEGVGALLARRLRGPRYIVWTHGEDVASALTSRELTFVMKRVYARASGVLANSRNTAELLVRIGVPEERIRVVYPGVDPGRFRPDVDGASIRARFAPAPGDILLLSVGRFQRRKGHDKAIEAVAALRRELPNLRYVLVGDGAERARLESLVRDHDLGGMVHFAGEVSSDDLPRYYAASDIFLLPNRVDGGDIEGFGIVFLEAAAAGKPVIGGRNGGVLEAVAEGETAILVEGTDVDELARAIRTLATDRDLRLGMGARGRERAVREFTWERAAAEVAALHREVAAAGGPP